MYEFCVDTIRSFEPASHKDVLLYRLQQGMGKWIGIPFEVRFDKPRQLGPGQEGANLGLAVLASHSLSAGHDSLEPLVAFLLCDEGREERVEDSGPLGGSDMMMLCVSGLGLADRGPPAVPLGPLPEITIRRTRCGASIATCWTT